MPGESGVTVVTTLVCFVFFAREAAGALGTRHSLRPLFSRANGSCTTRAPRVAGRRCASAIGASEFPWLFEMLGAKRSRFRHCRMVRRTRPQMPIAHRAIPGFPDPMLRIPRNDGCRTPTPRRQGHLGAKRGDRTALRHSAAWKDLVAKR